MEAQTDAKDAESLLNAEVDHLARTAHRSTTAVILPPLTAWMRNFVPYVRDVGFSQDNWKIGFDAQMTLVIFDRQPYKLQARMVDPAQTGHPTPEYFYHRSPAGGNGEDPTNNSLGHIHYQLSA